jgi:hypothetical protein
VKAYSDLDVGQTFHYLYQNVWNILHLIVFPYLGRVGTFYRTTPRLIQVGSSLSELSCEGAREWSIGLFMVIIPMHYLSDIVT